MHTLTSNMQQTFTPGFMKDNCGCYSEAQLMSCSFMKLPVITLRSIIESEISLKDKYWFVCKKLATKEQNQQIAVRVAEIVLPVYERRYPDDKRPREAIEAAKQFIAGHISLEELRRKRDAAAAAYAAAYAADAYAADAAYAAAYADAADAAYAAAYAADAADAIKQQLLDYLLTFCE